MDARLARITLFLICSNEVLLNCDSCVAPKHNLGSIQQMISQHTPATYHKRTTIQRPEHMRSLALRFPQSPCFVLIDNCNILTRFKSFESLRALSLPWGSIALQPHRMNLNLHSLAHRGHLIRLFISRFDACHVASYVHLKNNLRATIQNSRAPVQVHNVTHIFTSLCVLMPFRRAIVAVVIDSVVMAAIVAYELLGTN